MIEIILIFLQIVFLTSIIFYGTPTITTYNEYQKDLTSILSVKSIILANLFLIFSALSLQNYFLLFFLLIICVFFFVKEKQNLFLKLDLKFLYIVFLIFIISISFSSKLSFGWDTKFFWFMKVINFYQEESVFNLNKLPATDYPHLGSFIWAFFWKFPFDSYEYHGRIFYIFLYIISIFSFFEILKINQLKRLIYSTLVIISTFSLELISGNQEIIIFSLSLLSAKFIYLIFTLPRGKSLNTYLYILLLIFNFATWIKNEGLFIIGFMLLTLLFLADLNKSHKKILIFGSLLIVLLRFFSLKFLNTDLESFEFEETFSLNGLENLLEDIKIILFYFIFYLTQLPIMALGLILLLYNLYRYKLDKLLLFIFVYFLLNVLFIFGAFIFTMENVEWQVRVGLKRVMFETSGFYLISIAYLINKIQKKND